MLLRNPWENKCLRHLNNRPPWETSKEFQCQPLLQWPYAYMLENLYSLRVVELRDNLVNLPLRDLLTCQQILCQWVDVAFWKLSAWFFNSTMCFSMSFPDICWMLTVSLRGATSKAKLLEMFNRCFLWCYRLIVRKLLIKNSMICLLS